MNTQPQTFHFKDNTIRLVQRPDGPWFVAADVMDALMINKQAIRKVNLDQKGTQVIATSHGEHSMSVVSFQGLDALIKDGRRVKQAHPLRQRFKEWVVNDLLPRLEREHVLVDRSRADVMPSAEPQLSDTPTGIQSGTAMSFQFDELAVRTVTKDGEVWFVAADVCKALEIANNRDALTRLDDDEKGVALIDTLGGKQNISILNESGLYSLVLASRKPEAKRFKRWVTHDVLPAIRRHGSYQVDANTGGVQMGAPMPGQVPGIDPAALLLQGQSDPLPQLPASVNAAIDRQAWGMSHEAYVLLQEHLRRSVAYSAASRSGKMNEDRAIEVIGKARLGDALAHTWLDRFNQVRNMVVAAQTMSSVLLNEMDAMMLAHKERDTDAVNRLSSLAPIR